MTENIIIGALGSAIISMAIYIRHMHKQMVKQQADSAKEHMERTEKVTEAMILNKVALDGLTKVNDKIFDSITKATKR